MRLRAGNGVLEGKETLGTFQRSPRPYPGARPALRTRERGAGCGKWLGARQGEPTQLSMGKTPTHRGAALL